MDSLVNSLLRSLLPSEISRKTEVLLKNIALLLGLLSAIAIIFDVGGNGGLWGRTSDSCIKDVGGKLMWLWDNYTGIR